MIEPTLVPRRYKIEHGYVDYHYLVMWVVTDQPERPWVLALGGMAVPEDFLTARGIYDRPGRDTLFFATAEDALQHWKKMGRSAFCKC